MVDPARISVVPTGVDWRHYSDAAGPSVTEPLVVFVGSMDWEANIDGVDYFCREIWPEVKASVPERASPNCRKTPASPYHTTCFSHYRSDWFRCLRNSPPERGGGRHCASAYWRRDAAQDL